MATIVEIMDGIEARLATIPGLNTSDATPGQIATPAAVVGLPEEIDYLRTFTNDNVDLTFRIQLMVSTAADAASCQKALAAYMDNSGASSVLLAIEADETLGGLVDYCVLESCTPQPIAFNGNPYYGAVFAVRVSSSGA